MVVLEEPDRHRRILVDVVHVDVAGWSHPRAEAALDCEVHLLRRGHRGLAHDPVMVVEIHELESGVPLGAPSHVAVERDRVVLAVTEVRPGDDLARADDDVERGH